MSKFDEWKGYPKPVQVTRATERLLQRVLLKNQERFTCFITRIDALPNGVIALTILARFRDAKATLVMTGGTVPNTPSVDMPQSAIVRRIIQQYVEV